MGKKKSSAIGFLYLLGMALVAIGFCCPMFKFSLGIFGSATQNGFNFINFDRGTFVTIGALMIFVGGLGGVALVVLDFLKIKVPSAKFLRFVVLAVSIVGGIILVVGFNQSKIYKAVAKGLLKHAAFGFYMVLVGWVAGIVGFLMDK